MSQNSCPFNEEVCCPWANTQTDTKKTKCCKKYKKKGHACKKCPKFG